MESMLKDVMWRTPRKAQLCLDDKIGTSISLS
jgi:hypothetical protein